MIVELFLDVFKGVLIWLIGLVPSPEISLGNLDAVIDSFIEMFQIAAYFLPIDDIIIMLRIWLGIHTFNIVWKLIQRLWDALPLT